MALPPVKLVSMELSGCIVNVAKGLGPHGGCLWILFTYDDGRIVAIDANGAEMTVTRQIVGAGAFLLWWWKVSESWRKWWCW